MRRLSLATIAYILALLTTAPLAHSQAPARDDNVTINMRDADIRTLIQWISDQTGKNMVVHRDVQGKVTVLVGQARQPRRSLPGISIGIAGTWLSPLSKHPRRLKLCRPISLLKAACPIAAKMMTIWWCRYFKANNIGACGTGADFKTAGQQRSHHQCRYQLQHVGGRRSLQQRRTTAEV